YRRKFLALWVHPGKLRLGSTLKQQQSVAWCREAERYRLGDALGAAGGVQTAQVERLRQQGASAQEQEITRLALLCLPLLTRQYRLNLPGGHLDSKNSTRRRVRRYQDMLAIRQEARPA